MLYPTLLTTKNLLALISARKYIPTAAAKSPAFVQEYSSGPSDMTARPRTAAKAAGAR